MLSQLFERLDAWVEGFHGGASVVVLLTIAAVLGLRHATDLDHVTAVTSLAAGKGRKAASRIGMFWGLGHATTVTIFGLLVILTGEFLPNRVYQAAELVIGGVIMLLALWLLRRWWRGEFKVHSHSHEHDGDSHKHYHMHTTASHESHEIKARTPKQSYGIGLIHGLGGSAGASLLIVTLFSNKAVAIAALILFNICTLVSMTLVSGGFGHVLARPRVQRGLFAFIPVLACFSLVFGAVYSASALGLTGFSF